MAKIRAISNPMRTGRVGSDSFYIVKGVQIVRPSRNVTNYGDTAARSQAQQTRRVKWGNLVQFYKVSKLFMNKAFETKTKTQSDYNKFMSVNLSKTQVSISKDEANQGACVVEPLTVSMGSLRPVVFTVSETDVRFLPGNNYGISGTTTVGELATQIIANYPEILPMSQLSFIRYVQVLESGLPKVQMDAFEITLDPADSSFISSKMGNETLTSGQGALMWNIPQGMSGGIAIILSYSADGKGIRVSTQDVQLFGNTDIYDEYTSADNAANARESYGEDEEFFLESGDLNA